MRKLLLASLLLACGCAGVTPSSLSRPESLEQIRDECLRDGGTFRVSYGDYIHGWRPNEAVCWYGDNLPCGPLPSGISAYDIESLVCDEITGKWKTKE